MSHPKDRFEKQVHKAQPCPHKSGKTFPHNFPLDSFLIENKSKTIEEKNYRRSSIFNVLVVCSVNYFSTK